MVVTLSAFRYHEKGSGIEEVERYPRSRQLSPESGKVDYGVILGMIGKKQVGVLFGRDPLFAVKLAARLLLAPEVLVNLLAGRTEDMPVQYYEIGRDLLLKYNRIRFEREYSDTAAIDFGTLKEMLGKDHGPHYRQRSVVKWNSFLYTVCRIMRPETVVETGVYWGFSSTHILEALGPGGTGRLHSIDLTPERLVSRGLTSGVIVPERHRDEWDLRLGESRTLLPELLTSLRTVDIFIHDSEHTYDNMMFEYRTAWPHIRKGGLLVSHDVSSDSGPFPDFADEKGINYHVRDMIGFAVKN